MNDFIDNIKGIIVAQIKADKTISRITKELLNNFLDDHRIASENRRFLTVEEKTIILEDLANYFTADLNYDTDLVELIRGSSLIDHDPKMHTEWSPDIETRFYWRKQRVFLMSTLATRTGDEEASKIINSIDFETETILKNMENPLRPEFDSRGLVVGYVQSGKTANFTALIAKAADAGYRLIVVLAGIHDELRQQTQIRIDRELTGRNRLNLEGHFVEWSDFEEPRRWLNLTSAAWLQEKESGEFTGAGINEFGEVFLNKNRPVIAIIKKNVKVLNKFIKWVESSHKAHRNNVPILIVDDEADQASVDGNANKNDTLPARTNANIRMLLDLFKRKAYVGYTATPFANVFIQHNKENDRLGDDLYPRNFIHSLPDPGGYFGTKKIFNEDLDNYFVKEIKHPKEEKKEIADRGVITASLSEAIYTFIVSIAIRNLRNQGSQPMSMMINIDHRVNKMNRIGEFLTPYIEDTLPRHYKKADIVAAVELFLPSAVILNRKLNTQNDYFDKGAIIDEAINIIKRKELKIRTLNSSKDDKLDYAKDPSMKVIAIGGNKLSRGLTLEGLMTTFYLRDSKQFDTLLQMGRWFGYRKGYEDLVKIYTSRTLWDQFKDLAIVELEFRESIKEMVESGRTPKEFSLEVRHILRLLPTARYKLGAANLEKSYGKREVSVTRLVLGKEEIIDENYECAINLVKEIGEKGHKFSPVSKIDIPSQVARNVPWNIVEPFLKNFNIAKDDSGQYLNFDRENLVKYITTKIKSGNLSQWNIGLVSIGDTDNETIIDLTPKIRIRTVNRSRNKVSAVNGSYYIQALSSKSDRKMDLPTDAQNEYDVRQAPLLLLYFINGNSQSANSSREPLYSGIEDRMRNPVAYSIVFPADSHAKDKWKQQI